MAALHSLLLLLACSTALITAAPVLLQKHGARSESVQQAWIKQLIHQATSHAAAQQPEGVGVIAAQPSTSSLQSEVGFGCDFCRVVSTVLELYLEGGAQEEEIAKLIGVFCVLLEIEDQNVCDLVVEEFKHEVLTVGYYIALGHDKLACSALFGPESCPEAVDPWDQFWNITIPGNKPPVQPFPPPLDGSPVSRILHISDIHWDQNYTTGLSNDCGEPICCRPPNKPGIGPKAAGPWGDFNCDLPNSTLINLMQYLVTIQDKFDWIYMTGDLPAHNVWNQTRHDQLFILSTISSLMKQYLPSKKAYFSLGNHEGVPVNSFPPPFILNTTTGAPALQWLLDSAAENWGTWLSQESITTLKYGGYYNEKIYDGLRVISLQTNYGNDENYWLLINNTDPGGQLAWLVQQLLEAEKVGDKVHIIGHIPPSSFTYSMGWNYHDIVNRFESTIAGQFFGHTHKDEFEIFYDDTDQKRATSIVFIGPSITTDHANSGFRVYTVDGDYNESTHTVLDFDAYYMNLTDANLKNKPTWLEEYSPRTAYNMTGLHPADWADLVDRFKEDDELFQQYYRFKYMLHPPSPTCDASCKASILCGLVTSRTGDHSKCDQFLVGGVSRDDMLAGMEKMRGSC